MIKLFGREPAMWIQALTALLALFVGFGVPGLSDTLAAAVTALAAAIFAAVQALAVQPVAPTVFSGVIAAAAPLVMHFGLDLTQQQVGLVSIAVATVVGLLVRSQSTPVHDPSSSAV